MSDPGSSATVGWTRRRPRQEIAVLQTAARDGVPQVVLLEPRDALGCIPDQEDLASWP